MRAKEFVPKKDFSFRDEIYSQVDKKNEYEIKEDPNYPSIYGFGYLGKNVLKNDSKPIKRGRLVRGNTMRLVNNSFSPPVSSKNVS